MVLLEEGLVGGEFCAVDVGGADGAEGEEGVEAGAGGDGPGEPPVPPGGPRGGEAGEAGGPPVPTKSEGNSLGCRKKIFSTRIFPKPDF